MNTSLKKLIKLAAKVPMSDRQLEEQRRSFAYGTANIENESITRELVDKAADELKYLGGGKNERTIQRSR